MTSFEARPSCGDCDFSNGVDKMYKDGIARRHCTRCGNQIMLTPARCGQHAFKRGISTAGKPYCFCVHCKSAGPYQQTVATPFRPPEQVAPPPPQPAPTKRRFSPPPNSEEDALETLNKKMDYIITQLEILKQLSQ